MQVDPSSLHSQPGTTIHHTPAPPTHLEDRASQAEVSNMLRVKLLAVVQGEVPVTRQGGGALRT